jgi:hypothetical protein
MAARFDDATKQQQGRNEITANAVKRQQSAELRKMREEIYRMKDAYDNVMDEISTLKREKEADAKEAATEISTLKRKKEADAKTIALMEQSNAELRHMFHNCVEKIHQLTKRKRARFPSDSD